MNWRKITPVAFLIVGWFLIGWFARGLVAQDDLDSALLKQARRVIAQGLYGDGPTPRQVTYAGIRAMLRSTADKYTDFLEPAAAAHDSLAMAGDSGAIGLRGQVQENGFVLTQIAQGGPAEQAGLHIGDAILEVDGWKVQRDSTYSEVIIMIRGPVGSKAHLVVRRGENTLQFDVPRIPAPAVTSRMIGPDVADLRSDDFTDKTPQEVEAALKGLLASAPKGLVWDLRYNGGGRMNSTQQVLDLFLDEGMAFYARTKEGKLIPYPTRSGGIAEKVPLVVLIGPGTYSAPETAAASIADRGRGKLIGETTYGKGAIKDTIRLMDGSEILITVAQWLSPVHQELYEGKGVPPDRVVKQDPASTEDTQLQYAVDYVRRIQR